MDNRLTPVTHIPTALLRLRNVLHHLCMDTQYEFHKIIANICSKCYNIIGVTQTVSGCPQHQRDCDPLFYITCLEAEYFRTGGIAMITIEALLAVLSFGLTCFSVGYAVGSNSNSQK